MSEHNDSTQANPLQTFRIAGLPPDFYYIPNFISAEEEGSILGKIPAQRWTTLTHRRLQAHPSTLTKNNTLLAAPLPSYLLNPIVERFKVLGIFQDTPHQGPNHVLINEYKRGEGIMPHEDGDAYAEVVATVSLGAPICLEITAKMPKQGGDGVQPPNNYPETGDHVVHEVHATEHQHGIGTEVSKQCSIVQNALPTRILQEPRSLLITTGSAYTDLMHGIAPVEVDEDLNEKTVANWSLLANSHIVEQAGGRNERGTRVSLTYRDVLKVSKAAGKVFGMGRR